MFRFVSGGYDCGNNNPWTAENRAKNKYFFKHDNKRMHVRCDDFGRCWEMQCVPGTNFKRQSLIEAGDEELLMDYGTL